MCIFTDCLAQGARQERSGKEEETVPRQGAGRVRGAKGCHLGEGSSSEGMRETCVKSGPRLTYGKLSL